MMRTYYMFILLFFILFARSFCYDKQKDNNPNQHKLFNQLTMNDQTEDDLSVKYEQLLSSLSSFTGPETKEGEWPVSEQCSKDIELYYQTLNSNSSLDGTGTWALAMYDAYPKFLASGTLEGNFLHHPGAYDQCLKIDSGEFRGQYCLMGSIIMPEEGSIRDSLPTIQTLHKKNFLPLTLPPLDKEMQNNRMQMGFLLWFLRFSVCIPSSCTNDDAMGAVNNALAISTNLSPGDLLIYTTGCQAEDKPQSMTAGDIVIFTIVVVFGAIILISTLADIYTKYLSKNSFSDKILASFQGFSAHNNISKLFNTHQSQDSISCINGIRFLSMTWVIVGHTFQSMLFFQWSPVFTTNVMELLDPNGFLWTWLFTVVWDAQDSVDSFFLIGSVLLSYLTLKELDKTKGGNAKFWAMYYVHRYLRLTGVYLIVILLHTNLIKFLEDGPHGTWIDQNWGEGCREYWWANLLYVNNIVGDLNCLGHTWYLACEMQFFIWSPLVIYPLYKWPKFGLVWCGFLTVGATIIPMAITIDQNDPTTGWYGNDDMYYTDLYFAPHGRYQPYIVGIVVGYFLHAKRKSPKLELSPFINVVTWVLSTVVGLACVFGIARYHPMSDLVPSLAEQVLFVSFNRLAWSLALSWVIVACFKKRGGMINSILSWPGWIFGARLSYCMYLIHYTILLWVAETSRDVLTVSFPLYTIRCLANIMLSGGAALILVLMFEMPILHMEKLLFAALGLGSWPKCNRYLNEEIEDERAIKINGSVKLDNNKA